MTEPNAVDPEQMRIWGHKMVDMVADYWTNIRDFKPQSSVQPGYISNLVPTEAPEIGESLEQITKDIPEVIMNGLTHWLHPRFFAYFPTAVSYPSVAADILSSGLAVNGFTWYSSPACTELEMSVLDWLAKMLGLPEDFLHSHKGPGGGVIQGTASEAEYLSLLAAREKTILRENGGVKPSVSESSTICSKLIAYCSDQTHFAADKAGLIALIAVRKIPTDPFGTLIPEELEKTIEEDKKNGLIPFFCVATLGTTGTCAFDDLSAIGPICRHHDIWLHCDAAYAGSAFVCPEYRHLMKGIEFVDSFNFNPHKWLLTNFDCSTLWFKNADFIQQAFLMDSVLMNHDQEGKIPDFRNWQIPLGRRFRSLKLWFVIRAFGVSGLQAHIRKSCNIAKILEKLVMEDERFEIIAPTQMGLVCCRAKGTNELNERLHQSINKDSRVHLTGSVFKGKFFIRIAGASSAASEKDVIEGWKIIQEILEQITQ